MKTFALCLLLALAGAGCATHYDIVLTNGDVITSNSKPHMAKDRNVYLYTDASGHICGVKASQVSQIEPQSMMAADDKNSAKLFNPSLKK